MTTPRDESDGPGRSPDETVDIDVSFALRKVFDNVQGQTESEAQPSDSKDEVSLSKHYDLRDELARGGMGAIYEVWDGELKRSLAMKVLLDRGSASGGSPRSDDTLLTRFIEEAQITGQLDHPGTVSVHDVGIDASGKAFFTMSLVKGRELGEVFELAREERGGWTQARVIGLLVRVCETLAYAHSKGVIHRDLKPGNIMVGRFGEVYVMDWGLAKVIGRADSHDLSIDMQSQLTQRSISTDRRDQIRDVDDSPLVTMDGVALGTPAYMPPEQAEGRLTDLGPRSDIYSVGTILYQLLAGQPPYVTRGERVSPHAILARVTHGPPRELTDIDGSIPPELVAICDKAMARSLEGRYETALDLARDLQAFLDQRVVTAYRTGAVAELRKWITRNRMVAGVATAAVLIVLAGLLGIFLVQRSATQEIGRKHREATRANETALEQTRLAEARLRDVLSLSDVKRLRDCVEAADDLWPCLPEQVPAMEQWIAEATALVGRLPDHRQQLARLRELSQPPDEADSDFPGTTPDQLLKERLTNERKELEGDLRKLGKQVDLDDSATIISFGDDEDRKPAACYFRLSFSLPKAVEISRWKILYDDGAIVYLDGREITRVNMPRGAVQFDTLAESTKSGLAELEKLDIEPIQLAAGAHIVSVEVHQRQTSSSDLLFDMELRAGKEKVIRSGSIWRYDDSGTPPPEDWFASSFDDSTWPTGPAPLGYGFRSGIGEYRELERRIADTDRELANIEQRVQSRRRWRFTSTSLQWRHDTLVDLVSDLEQLARSEASDLSNPSLGGVRQRLRLARDLERNSVETNRVAWEDATRSIANQAECPHYAGLRIKPQTGLVPLGKDRDSGLWEFVHIATGYPPRRDVNGRLEITESSGIVFVLCPGGTFRMGADKPPKAGDSAKEASSLQIDPQATSTEGPSHDVTLSPFFISKYEMTQGQWRRLAGDNPSIRRPERGEANLRHPVEQVSWIRASTVLSRFGMILPTEAQWEYAARAGTKTPWWTGSEPGSISSSRGGNVADKSCRKYARNPTRVYDDWDDDTGPHAPVGSFAPNAFGLHDTIGNVQEWCLDGRLSYDRAVANETGQRIADGPAETRVCRGGSWYLPSVVARSSFRDGRTPESVGNDLGVRAALRLKP